MHTGRCRRGLRAFGADLFRFLTAVIECHYFNTYGHDLRVPNHHRGTHALSSPLSDSTKATIQSYLALWKS